jgi:AraC family transcriptional regulator
MRAPPDVHVSSAFDSLVFHLSRPVLDELARDADAGPIEDFGCRVLEDLSDPVAYSLGSALLPALERQHPGDGLFIDHASWALRYHLMLRYARLRVAPTRGGLTPRQLNRAKELMSEQLRGGLTLSQLATECGLSRSHFVRAFRQSTGVPPHRWLQRRRLERAQELLRNGKSPLREVAQACGFADASHLSRTFTEELGTSPVTYRRTARR